MMDLFPSFEEEIKELESAINRLEFCWGTGSRDRDTCLKWLKELLAIKKEGNK